jgi:hypothetical protein
MLPVGVKVPIDCAKAPLQNQRTKTNCNAPDLLVILFLNSPFLGRVRYLALDSIQQH